ncbi:MAG: hypothetical protein LBT25_05355 [Candidatus Symbiothrix sp.]|jgi:hypothetical protein|nr:hypothetical protein [Candidatus Symbiothrix sp.]
MNKKAKSVIRFIIYVIIAYIGIWICVIALIAWGLSKENKADEMERKERLYKESHFIIPSNGEDSIRIEYKFTHRYKSNAWVKREDYYYVYNYKASDSLYILHYIDSIRFHKWLEKYTNYFYWYNPALPDTLRDIRDIRHLRDFNYWTITYEKSKDVYSYWQMGNGKRSEISSYLYFKYDTIQRRYRLDN